MVYAIKWIVMFSTIHCQDIPQPEPKPEPPSFNILSLDGAGVDSLISAYVLNLTERMAYNICTNTNSSLSCPTRNNRVAIKDIF